MTRTDDHCPLCADMIIVSSIIRGLKGGFDMQSPRLKQVYGFLKMVALLVDTSQLFLNAAFRVRKPSLPQISGREGYYEQTLAVLEFRQVLHLVYIALAF